MQTPETLLEAVRIFSDPLTCLEYTVRLRWPNGVACPHCSCMDVTFMACRRIWQCKCRKQFSVKKGTIFEDSQLGLDKWLIAMWLVANSKNGVSSHELARAIGVKQKSAWFMLHRIRLAMQTDSFDKPLTGTIEADDIYIGGLKKQARKQEIALSARG